jgi:hypothetical protein
MSEKVSYQLQGPGIEIRYQEGDLFVNGEGDHLLEQRHFGDDLTTLATEIGTLTRAVLLPSSRNGTRFTLTLLLPDVNATEGVTECEVTGAAIITREFHDLVGGPPTVLQAYDIRPLAGSATRPTSSSQEESKRRGGRR